MTIDELDEWQGLTRELVDRVRHVAPSAHVSFKMGLGAAIERIAAIVGSTPQAILREINPRMRKGMPSRAALEAHGENGDWVVFRNVLHAVRFVWTVCDAVQMVSGFDVFRSDNPEDAAMIAECSFWPCDKHGNKVRWPTDADGKML